MSAPDLAPLESDDERPADLDAAPADEQAAELERLDDALARLARSPRSHRQPRHGEKRTMNTKTTTTTAGADLACANAPVPADALDGQEHDATGAEAQQPAQPAPHLASLPPTGDPTMNEDKRAELALEAKQLERSIADATAAGQTLRAEKLTERRARILARVSA